MRRGVLALSLLLLLGAQWAAQVVWDPEDPLLHLDLVDAQTGRPAEIVPGTPWIRVDPSKEGDSDAVEISSVYFGDADIVARSGSLPASAEPFGGGARLPVTVTPLPGAGAPPYWDGLPFLVLAFPDLDGDGYVGITHLDGDVGDAEIEAAELYPAGRRYAVGYQQAARTELAVSVGGPVEAPVRLALVAAAYAGPFDASYRAGVFPNGPAVMTQLPFLPYTDPDRVRIPGPIAQLGTILPSRVAIDVQPAYVPDPSDPRVGEAFTLRLDGLSWTIGVGTALSGEAVRFGLARTPDPARYLARRSRPLRPGIDDAGRRTLLEILRELKLRTGSSGATTLRLVPLDRLGNVASPAVATAVTVRSTGQTRIDSPDRDGNPYVEALSVVDAAGTPIQVSVPYETSKSAVGNLLVEGLGGISRVDIDLYD